MKASLLVAAVALSTAIGLAGPASAGDISPYLAGTNLWYKDPSPQVWALTKQAGVSLVRIGGADYDRTLPDNATLVRWVKQVRAIGAEPLLQMSQYQPAARAAALVRLFNQDKAAGAPVRFWSIGNEPWLQNGKPDFAKVAAMIEAYTLPIAAAMKDVDPTIKILGPDTCDYFDAPLNELFGGAHNIAGKVPGKPYYYVDGLTWHRYPQIDREPGLPEMKEFEERSQKARALVDRANQQLGRTGKDALVWGITEFNAKNGPLVHTWGDGQFFAAVYGYAMKYDAITAANWSMFEHAGDRLGTDFSLIDGAHMAPRATYWHMQLVSRYFKGHAVDGHSSAAGVITYAAADGDRVSVMILNTTAEPVTYELSTTGAAGTPQGIVTLTLDTPLPRSVHGTIAGRSTQVLLIEQGAVRKISYTEDDFKNERPPGEPVAVH